MPDTKCFCSSRPPDIPSGREWFRTIFDNAKNSQLCLMMLSPYSANNNWLHFEAGLVLGAADINETLLVPVLYGGIKDNNIPGTVHHIEYLSLEDSAKFSVFISNHFLKGQSPTSAQMLKAFKEGLSSKAARLLKFGEFGSCIFDKVLTEKLGKSTSLKSRNDAPNDLHTLKRFNRNGELIAVRAKIVPRRSGSIQSWKFGISLIRRTENVNSVRIFQFHSGCHAGLNTWTIYCSPDNNHPVNESARLETERASTLEIWLSSDKSSVACIGVDSDNRYKVLMNDRWEKFWRLKDDTWNGISIEAWADGEPFQVDLVDLEVDRIPYLDPIEQSNTGGVSIGHKSTVVLDLPKH